MLTRLPIVLLLSALPVLATGPSKLTQSRQRVLRVRFLNAGLLSDSEKAEISKTVLASVGTLDANNRHLLIEMAKESVRAAYQDKGYMKAETESWYRTIEDSHGQALQISVSVKSEGLRYRVQEIELTGGTVFTKDALLSLMPIQPGKTLTRREAARGLEAWRRLYAARGYINFTTVPDLDFDDETGQVALGFDIDEGKQFHFGELHLAVFDDRIEEVLNQGWQKMQGQPFSQEELEKFFQQYFQLPNPRISSFDYTWLKVNNREGTVDIFLTFAPPPPRQRHSQK